MIEQVLTDFQAADETRNVAILRYFNPVGAHASGLIGEDPSGIPNNIMPFISQVAVRKLEKLQVFGNDYPTRDGTGVRDYIHVVDLAKGHLAALNRLHKNPGVVIYNLGTGQGYSVMELVSSFETASGVEIPYEVIDRRSGDIPESYADPGLAEKELDWKAEKTLGEMCKDTWHWQSKNPNGYHS
jgi:UDP-glucose 4-epimerase